jgi:hypothetical protein
LGGRGGKQRLNEAVPFQHVIDNHNGRVPLVSLWLALLMLEKFGGKRIMTHRNERKGRRKRRKERENGRRAS